MQRLLALLILGATAIAHAATVTVTPGQTRTLGARTVTLLRVQDSRCPINARCVRAGELKTTLLVTEGTRSRVLHVQLPSVGAWQGVGISGATEVEIGKRTPVQITLTDVPT